MNASKFMDKQIMDLSRSKSDPNATISNGSSDFLDLMNPQSEEDSDGGSSALKKKNNTDDSTILPNYDFQPISRPVYGVPSLSSSSADASAAAAARSWNSLDAKPNSSSPLRNYNSVDPVEPEKVVLEKAHKANDSVTISDIDRTMKKYTDSLLHAIDSLSARLSQLESRTRNLEYSVDELKVSIGNNHGSADGKMRQLENILLEVQTGVQNIKDKQEVMEGHMQLAKLQISQVEKSSATSNTVQVDHVQHAAASAPPQQPSLQQFPVGVPQPVPSLSPNAPPPPQQNIYSPLPPNVSQPVPSLSPNAPPPPQQTIHAPPGAAQLAPAQIPGGPQRDAYFPPHGHAQETPSHQQYQIPPPAQQPPTAAPPPPQQYQPAPTPPYPQPPQPPQQQLPSVGGPNAPPQFQPSLGHHPEETPFIPQTTYPPNLRPATPQPSSGAPPSHQYYGGAPPIYEPPPVTRSSSGFSSAYGPPSGPGEPYGYGGPPSHYGGGSSTKPQPHSPGRSGGNYPQLPTARVLPQAIPTATSVSGGGSGSGGSGNRVPIDDVIDKVTSMGFPREHVRATVRRLTENGQSVDLNVVLDKLMNDSDVQPPRGWFGR